MRLDRISEGRNALHITSLDTALSVLRHDAAVLDPSLNLLMGTDESGRSDAYRLLRIQSGSLAELSAEHWQTTL